METTAEAVLAEVRRLAAAVERLDYSIRGNGVEGLSTKVAKHEMLHGDHTKKLDALADREAAVERRVMWFAGVGGGVGALLVAVIPALLERVL